MKYRKKPVVVEAMKWSAFQTLIHDVMMFGGGNLEAMGAIRISKNRGNLIIRTLEGDMIANDGDYIIRGIKGELYPCKPDIFEQTYELVEG